MSFLSRLIGRKKPSASRGHYAGNRRFAHLKDQEIELGAAARAHLAVFVHIPKAGGTTLKNLMVANYGRRYRDFHPRLSDLREEPETLVDLHALSAHMPYGYHLALAETLREAGHPGAWDDRKPFVFSITRDPVDRLVSSYNFITTFPVHVLYKESREMDPEQFFAFFKVRRPGEFHNLQCRFIAGNRHATTFGEARASLEAKFAKVVDLAAQSRLVEFLIERLGWTPTGEEDMRLNESPKKLRRADLGSNLLRLIEDANQEDLRLADHVRSLD